MRKQGHNLSHYVLDTFDLGQVVPVGFVEVLPGDTFRHSTNLFARLTPMAFPVMHPVTVRLHHFYVPHRIVWEDAGGTGTWEDFITGGNAGTDNQLVPTYTTTGAAGDLMDKYGIPAVSGIEVSALPFAGYNLIWNEWYRDQDLMTERLANDLTIARCAWGKDYITAARPFPQRGTEVALPLGTEAPVKTLASATQYVSVLDSADAYKRLDASAAQVQLSATGGVEGQKLFADLSAATAASVTDLRLAFALQRYKELRAQLGARYPEYLRTFGVRDPDGRLQIPEYLGGGSQSIAISEVLQTSPTTAAGGRSYDVGDLYGHGTVALRGNSYVRRFEEWGYVHTLCSIRPAAIYADGIPRTLLQQDKEDFWTPQLENVGEQAIWNNEVYAVASGGGDTFGYQGRYDQYRGCMSRVAGEFRETTLDYAHLGRLFAAQPSLNETFVTCTPSKRVFNEQTQNSVWAMIRHRIGASRGVARRATTRTL